MTETKTQAQDWPDLDNLDRYCGIIMNSSYTRNVSFGNIETGESLELIDKNTGESLHVDTFKLNIIEKEGIEVGFKKGHNRFVHSWGHSGWNKEYKDKMKAILEGVETLYPDFKWYNNHEWYFLRHKHLKENEQK
jgi:hypothetical protein